jgi:D-alanyl-D-alanine dipeptidase
MGVNLLRPIPIGDTQASTYDYRTVPIDIRHPKAQEPLVRLADYGIAGDNYYARNDGSNPPYDRRIEGSMDGLWVRLSVADMLVDANRLLRPQGIELYVLDGYRPIACQLALWTFFRDQYKSAHPGASESAVEQAIAVIVSDPRSFSADDPTTWTLHATGGAVDVVLRDLSNGAMVDLGGQFDWMGPESRSDALERRARQGLIAVDDPRLVARRRLHAAMAEVGFTNYFNEYWHFDYGTQMQSLMQVLAGDSLRHPAFYGYIDTPESA